MNEVKPAVYCERCYTLMVLPLEEYYDGAEIDCAYCNNIIILQDTGLDRKICELIDKL